MENRFNQTAERHGHARRNRACTPQGVRVHPCTPAGVCPEKTVPYINKMPLFGGEIIEHVSKLISIGCSRVTGGGATREGAGRTPPVHND